MTDTAKPMGSNVTSLPGTNSALSGGGFVRAVNDWLMERALEDTDIDAILEGMVSRLVAVGIPLDRVMVGFKTLHPLYEGVTYIWSKNRGTVERSLHLDVREKNPDWLESPMKWMADNDVTFLRRHPIGPVQSLILMF